MGGEFWNFTIALEGIPGILGQENPTQSRKLLRTNSGIHSVRSRGLGGRGSIVVSSGSSSRDNFRVQFEDSFDLHSDTQGQCIGPTAERVCAAELKNYHEILCWSIFSQFKSVKYSSFSACCI